MVVATYGQQVRQFVPVAMRPLSVLVDEIFERLEMVNVEIYTGFVDMFSASNLTPRRLAGVIVPV
jgi:hypothetical protein